MKVVNWRDRIVCNPDILLGKPTRKGTRLSVAFIVKRLADGWSDKMLYDNYPRLTSDDLQAIFGYAANPIKKEFAITKRNRKLNP